MIPKRCGLRKLSDDLKNFAAGRFKASALFKEGPILAQGKNLTGPFPSPFPEGEGGTKKQTGMSPPGARPSTLNQESFVRPGQKQSPPATAGGTDNAPQHDRTCNQSTYPLRNLVGVAIVVIIEATMNRRYFLLSLGALAALAGFPVVATALWQDPKSSKDKPGKNLKSKGIKKVIKTDAEWKQQLTPEQYNVMRQKGTEAPFTSPLNDIHDQGTFECAACELPLFSSATEV